MLIMQLTFHELLTLLLNTYKHFIELAFSTVDERDQNRITAE